MIKIKTSKHPIMPDSLLPRNFNKKEISAGVKNKGQFNKKKNANRNKRKQAKKSKRKNR